MTIFFLSQRKVINYTKIVDIRHFAQYMLIILRTMKDWSLEITSVELVGKIMGLTGHGIMILAIVSRQVHFHITLFSYSSCVCPQMAENTCLTNQILLSLRSEIHCRAAEPSSIACQW